MIKTFEEYITEQESINEGKILDSIKNAIKNISKTPEKYINIANKEIEKLKDSASFKCKIKDTEKYIKKLEELNNNDDISHIFKYGKKKVQFGGIYRAYLLEEKTDEKTMTKLYKNLDKEFNCDGDNDKIKAVLDILNTLMYEYCELQEFKNKQPSKSSSYSSYSSSSKKVAQYSAVTAAMMIRKR